MKVTVTGAAGQIGYASCSASRAARCSARDTPVALRLLEIPAAVKAAEGTAMELDDCAFPLLAAIEITDDPNVAFDGVNIALLVGARPRGPGMERADLLEANGGIFKPQGAGDQRARRGRCAGARRRQPGQHERADRDVARARRAARALHRDDAPRPQSRQGATRGEGWRRRRRGDEHDVWGNHSATQYPDIFHAKVGRARRLPR